MCGSNASDVMEKLGVTPRSQSSSESSDSSEDTEQLVPFDMTNILTRVQAYLMHQPQPSSSNAVTLRKKALALVRALLASHQSQSVSESARLNVEEDELYAYVCPEMIHVQIDERNMENTVNIPFPMVNIPHPSSYGKYHQFNRECGFEAFQRQLRARRNQLGNLHNRNNGNQEGGNQGRRRRGRRAREREMARERERHEARMRRRRILQTKINRETRNLRVKSTVTKKSYAK
jgi:hypothetical protein